MSEFALKNPSFNRAFVSQNINFKIKELDAKEKAQAAANRKKAMIIALELGYDIGKLNFFDHRVLK